MNRGASLVLAAVLGGVVVGGIVWLTKPEPVPATAPSRSAPAATASAAPVVDSRATQAASAPDSGTPPWADHTGGAGASSPANLGSAISLSPQDQAKATQRAALRARIQKLTAGGRHPTPAEMDSVLGDMQRMEGSSVVAGVDIEALRQNLANVQKLQRVSQELQAESQKPGGGDKQKIQALLAQLKQIQSNMNYNVARGASAQPAR